MEIEYKITNYSQFLNGDQKEKFQSRLDELVLPANKFIEEAKQWISVISEETKASMELQQTVFSESESGETDPNHPGPQDGTGVNPNKKGSTTGLNSFHGTQNK